MDKPLSDKLIPPNAVSLSTTPTFKERFRAFWADKGYLSASFLIPFALMTMIYAGIGVWPFGNRTILMLDMNGQYIYFFEQIRDILLGDGSLLYTFERAVGGEFFGIFAYYLSSPFSLVTLLFPESMITESVFFMLVLKCAASGLTFGIYLHATRKRSPFVTVIFSTIYALTAYGVVMQHNTFWFDNVILLPLIVLAIEHLIKYGHFKLYVICLAWAVFSNFYIGYMMCLFVALYFFYYFIANPSSVVNPRNEKGHFLKSLGRIALFSAVAIGIAAYIVLTIYYSLQFGKSDFTDPNYTVRQRFDFLDAISKLYIGSYDTVDPYGLPMIYSGLFTIILIPIYFLSKRIRLREKAATCFLCMFFFASFNFSWLDLIWHGFQRPNWLNYRFAFMLCFFFVLMAVKAFDSLKEVNYSVILGTIAAWSVLLLILEKLEYEHIRDFACVWLSLLFFAIYAFVIKFVTTTRLKQTAMTLLASVVTIEMFVGGLLNMAYLVEDVGYASRISYRQFIDTVRPASDWVLENDDSFYRFEKTISRKVNDNFALNIRGFSNSTSTLNESIIVLLNKLGIASKSHWSLYTGASPVFDTLFGVKYLITPINLENLEITKYQTYSYKTREGASELYELAHTVNDQFAIYKNPDALSIAYCVDTAVKDFDLLNNSYQTPFERMNALLSAMSGSSRAYRIYDGVSYDRNAVVLDNCERKIMTGIRKYTRINSSSPASITYTVTAKKDGHIYCYFPSDAYSECDLLIRRSGEAVFTEYSTYFGNETYTTVDLGSYTEGEIFEVRLRFDANQLSLASKPNYFVYIDEDLYDTLLEPLKEGQLNITEWSDTEFIGTITAKENQMVFTTLPYDEGWKITVDGEAVETYKVLDSLLAFDIEEGDHDIRMVYRPTVFVAGTTISIGSIFVFAGLWALDSLLKKKNKNGFTVPGTEIYEEFMEVWEEEEEEDDVEAECITNAVAVKTEDALLTEATEEPASTKAESEKNESAEEE